MLDYAFDRDYASEYGIVCGTDEAGRGPLCGPVTAAAVVLPADFVIEGLDDSKKLTDKKREKLYDVIVENALAYGIAESTPAEIDEINILAASLLAMRRAVKLADEMLCERGLGPVGCVLIDGNRQTDFGVPSFTVVHGDALSQSIAAASILAKVTRDREMTEVAAQYPGFGIEVHKGYPTPAHKLAVYKKAVYGGGLPDIYRRSFLSFIERDRDKLEAKLALEKEAEHG
ncbi:MAG: ribonuclease HII [Clostridia bacterium]|nr:ribonuclease HII [Clostridia bacterium]